MVSLSHKYHKFTFSKEPVLSGTPTFSIRQGVAQRRSKIAWTLTEDIFKERLDAA